jgi:uncharacterized damage-inducible protein DinB
MMEEIRRLCAHMRWADERVLKSLRSADPLPADAVKLFAHVLGAEHTWLSRLRQQSPRMAVWPTLTLDECEALSAENAEGYEAFLDALEPGGLAREVEYRNSAGQEFRSRIGDILLQAATHGGYHRGQVAMLLRQAGAEPMPTDYIAFVRGVPAATTRA